MQENEKPNTFATLAAKKENQQTATNQPASVSQGEISVNNFSDTPVGEKKKYNRPDLDGKTDVVAMFQVFPPDITQEPMDSLQKTSKYWLPTMILTYESENDEGIKNREYISGGKVFQNSGGNTDPMAIQFWYEGGAEADNQSCYLWESVAEALKIAPDQMSPRQFISFLNGKPKVQIVAVDVKNWKAKPGEPKFIKKNMPGKFLV